MLVGLAGVVLVPLPPATAMTLARFPVMDIVTAPGPGGGPNIRTFGTHQRSFTVPGFGTRSGAFVAAGDLGGDALDEIVVGTGAGVPAQVKVFNGDGSPNQLSLHPYPGFSGGVHVAVDSSRQHLVTAPGAGGGPNVKVFASDGQLLSSFLAYDPAFRGGVNIALGDVDRDGLPDIITGPGPGGGDDIRVFDASGHQLGQSITAFFGLGTWTGGATVAAGDVDGDAGADLVIGAGPGGGPHVRPITFSAGRSLGGGFFAFSDQFHGGVSVGTIWSQDRLGVSDILAGAGPGGGPNVKRFAGDGTLLDSFFAYDPRFHGGVQVASATVAFRSGR